MPFGCGLIRRRHSRDEGTAPLQDRERALLNLSANEIDDGIDSADLVFEMRRPIDHLPGAETAHISEISGAGGGDYAQPGAPGKLNRIGADISSRAGFLAIMPAETTANSA